MSMAHQVAVLAVADAPWLGRWRTLPHHEACEAEGRIWLRGPVEANWAALPALERYRQDAAGRLIPEGRRVPVRGLPAGNWQALTDFLRVRPAAAALPAQHVAPVAWTLVQAETYQPAGLLVLPFETLAPWALRTAAVRLRGLRFALAEDGRACVRGELLPALPGDGWSVDGSIATPAGWTLPKGLTPALVAAALRLAPGELALVKQDATAERLPAEAFVEMTRSAIRATRRAAA
jgi:hypothetical protein